MAMKKVPALIRPRPPADGFALIELVIATTIGAMLLVSLAEVVQLVGQDGEAVSESVDSRVVKCLTRMTEETSRAWIVQQPEPDVLLLADARGRETRYSFDQGTRSLTVTRDSGATGTVLTDVQGFTVHPQIRTRYRDSRPLDSHGIWWERTHDGSTLEALPIEEGLRVSLGFTLSTHAPDWVHTVDGVTEQTRSATLEHILVPLAFAPPLQEPSTPSTTVGGATVRPESTESVLFVDLHEAVAPEDARPFGPSLGSISLPASILPAGSWSWMTRDETDASTFGSGESGSTVVLCHAPPRNPLASHAVHVSSNAVAWHLEHGDTIGSCDDANDGPTTRVLLYAPPTADTTLDLTPLNALIQPGRAYTLVFRLSGPGAVLMAGHPLGTTTHTGIAASHSPGGAFSALDFSIPFSLDGMRTCSQTVAHEVIQAVNLELRMLDGATRTGSVSVLSQMAVDDPWLGCVPGEFPGLELVGP